MPHFFTHVNFVRSWITPGIGLIAFISLLGVSTVVLQTASTIAVQSPLETQPHRNNGASSANLLYPSSNIIVPTGQDNVMSTIRYAGDTDTQLRATVPDRNGSSWISSTNPDGIGLNGGRIAALAGPEISRFSPNNRRGGTDLPTGPDFGGATAPVINRLSTRFAALSGSDIQAILDQVTPRASPLPAISSFMAPEGPIEAAVVAFNEEAIINFTTASNTQIRTEVPLGATTAKIGIANATGSAWSRATFSVIDRPTFTVQPTMDAEPRGGPFNDLALTPGATTESVPMAANSISTDPDFKVAFIGDSNDGSGFQNVLNLILSENVNLVLHQGDFSYASGPPTTWVGHIDTILGSTFPYLGSDGNHDDWNQYKPFFENRLAAMGLGPIDLNVGNYSVTYGGLKMVFVKEPGNDPDFINQSLAADNHIWKICSWHHNMNDMQVGGKGDAVGWPSYQTCQDLGAIIATGHEHSYERTYTLTGQHSNDNHPVVGLPDQLVVSPGSPGKSFVFVSGLGGQNDKRDYEATQHDDDGWWATIYTSNRYCKNSCTDIAAVPPVQDKTNDIPTYDYEHGALFITFHVDGNPNKARGYFKNVFGQIIDEFEIIAGEPTWPTISGFSPTSGAVGTEVAITGTNFNGATEVTFNGTAAISFTVESDTQIRADVPAGATAGLISVTNIDGSGFSAGDFMVNAPPAIIAFGPDSGQVGTEVTLSGSSFTGVTEVTFNGEAASTFTVDSDTQIRANVPGAATTGFINVTNAFGSDLSDSAFTVITTPAPQADLAVVKLDAVDPVTMGEAVTYTVTVSNNGPDSALNVLLTDTLPAGITFGSASPSQGSCSQAGGTVTCTLDAIANGATVEVSLVVNTTTPGAITNIAQVSSNTPDPLSGNNDTSEVTTVIDPGAEVTTFEIRVAAGSDDAEERANGSMYLTSSDLELVYDGGGDQTIGMRFNGINIPQGATISNAFVQFQVDESKSDPTSLTIQGQDADNATTFTSATDNISSRPTTAADAYWAPVPWTSVGQAGANQQTPEITSIIQEIVSRPGWAEGNSLVLIISGTGERVAESFNGVPAAAPLLHVEFSTGPPNQAPLAGNDSYDTAEDITLNVAGPGVLANDTDTENNPLTAVLDTTTSNGVLNLSDDGSFSYTPNGDFNGVDSFSYLAHDGASPSNVATVNITVAAVNDAPIAVNDSYNTDQSTLLNVAGPGVLANDTDTENNPLTAVLDTSPSSGSLILNADGSFDYTPNPSFEGNASFTYHANDGGLNSNIAVVDITVTVPNDPPLAQNDSISGDEDSLISGNVLADNGNQADSDPDANLDPNSVSLVGTGPTDGTLNLNQNGSFDYTPNADFNGLDGFDYQVCDDLGACDTATVTITVNAVNDAPVGMDDGYSTAEDTPLNVGGPGVLANDTDAENAPLTAVLDTGPSNGTLSLNADGSFDYTPAQDFFGSDSFSYHANDGGLDSNSAVVIITVNPAAPDILEVRVAAGSDDAEQRANGSMYLTSSDLELVYDGGGDQTIGMRFNGINIPPGATISNAFVQFQVDESKSDPTSLTIQGQDADHATTFTSATDNISSRPTTAADAYWAPVPWTSVGQAGANQQTPDITSIIQEIVSRPGWASGNSLVLIISGTGERVAESFNGVPAAAPLLHIEYSTGPPNQAPVAGNDSYDTAEDITLNVAGPGVLANDTDTENNPLTAVLDTTTSNGVLNLSGDGSFSYTPNADFNGVDSFSYLAHDGASPSNVATVNITVAAVNDAPIAVNDSFGTDEDTTLIVARTGVLANDTDTENNPLTAVLDTTTSNGVLNLSGDGSFSYTPNGDFNGVDSFIYHANDGSLNSNIAVVDITVTVPNDPPLAQNDSISGDEDSLISGNVLADNGNLADSDLDDNLDPNSVSLVGTGPTAGTLNLNQNGSFDYTPNADFNGLDGFDYQVCDDLGACDTATVTITVNAVNDAPVGMDDGYSTAEDTPLNVGGPGVLANDTDTENAPLTAVLDTSPSNGTLSLNADGSFDYTPAPGFFGSDSFSYHANDGGLDSNSAVVIITVNPAAPEILEIRVAASLDDAEEYASGRMYLDSSDLELVFGNGSNQTVGMRFNGINIPPGATISSAYVQFQVDETKSGAADLTIKGQAADNAPAFSSAAGNISSRQTTAAAAFWSPAPWTSVGDAGIDQQTPDIASIIQEIVNGSGWASGNSLVIIITGSGTRTAESYNGVQSAAPLLHLEFSPGSAALSGGIQLGGSSPQVETDGNIIYLPIILRGP